MINTDLDFVFGKAIIGPSHVVILLITEQWCGLRPSVLRQDRSETKKIGLGLVHCGLGSFACLHLAGLVLCCETRSCHARHHNDLEGHSDFQVLFIVSLFCAWNITTVEINSGVHLLKSWFHLFVKTSIPGHSLHHLLPPYRSSNLRERGHSFHLPDYDTVLFKKSFIVHSLYKFVASNY